jgi:tubulin gamma
MPSDTAAGGAPHLYIAALSIIQGEADPLDVHKSLNRIQERQLAAFCPWTPSGLHVTVAKKSPFIKTAHRVSGLLLANHTSVSTLFKRTCDQYDRLRKRNAFLDMYRREPIFADSLEEFDVCRGVVQDLMDEYEAAQSPNYISRWKDAQNPLEILPSHLTSPS